MTAQIMTQGAFDLFYTFVFAAAAIKLWTYARSAGSPIAKYLSMASLFAAAEYAAFSATYLIFSENQSAVRFMVGPIVDTTYFIAIGFGLPVLALMYPRFRLKPALAAFSAIALSIIIYDYFHYQPGGILPSGLLDLSLPVIPNLICTALFMLIFVPICIIFLRQTIKQRSYVVGLGLGLGLLLIVLFQPLVLVVDDFKQYLMISAFASLGFVMLLAGVVLHPLMRGDERQDRANGDVQ